MGARINYIFNEGEEQPAVWLYSHWGEDEWEIKLAAALNHARPRWTDTPYCIRMIISHMIQHEVLDETGYGIGAVDKPSNFAAWDTTIDVDMVNKMVDGHTWDEFINYHLGVTVQSTKICYNVITNVW